MTIKSRKMISEGHVVQIAEMRNAYTILVGNPEKRGQFGDVCIGTSKDNIKRDQAEL
jgi:hypothetical protein